MMGGTETSYTVPCARCQGNDDWECIVPPSQWPDLVRFCCCGKWWPTTIHDHDAWVVTDNGRDGGTIR